MKLHIMSYVLKAILVIFMLTVFIVTVQCTPGNGDDDDDDNSNWVNVSGSVFDTNNDPIAGAQVEITSDPVTTITDSQGYFSAMVVPGSHTITITKSHMDIYVEAFSCGEDMPLNLGDIMTSYDPIAAAADDDGDGYSEEQDDCDDNDPDVYPGAIEICDDEIDNDCDDITDCADTDCDADPVCNVGEPGDIQLQWLSRTEPVVRFEYSGGIVVRMKFYKNFLITAGSGIIQMTADIKKYEEPDTLDEQTVAFDVQANQAYEVTVEVDVSSWGSCNPEFTHSMIFSSPAATETSQIDLYAFFDSDTNWFESAGSYAIQDMRIQAYGE